MSTVDARTIPTTTIDATENWEPFVEGGRQIGEVHWLAVHERPEGTVATGLWRIDAESGAEIPYAVTGSETFHVLEGQAVLEPPEGEPIELKPGMVVSFPDGFTATWRTRSAFKKFFVVA